MKEVMNLSNSGAVLSLITLGNLNIKLAPPLKVEEWETIRNFGKAVPESKLRSFQKDVANLFEQRSRSLISHLELPENSFNS